MNELRAQLLDLIDKAAWEWLEEHAQEGRLLIVAPNLELVDVGLALAEDNISMVKEWLDDGWLYKPTDFQMSNWHEHKDLEFESLIVQPFVITRAPMNQS